GRRGGVIATLVVATKPLHGQRGTSSGGQTVLEQRGDYRYGDSQSDIRDEALKYSKAVGYLAHHFADAVCRWGGRAFKLLLDDDEGGAVPPFLPFPEAPP